MFARASRVVLKLLWPSFEYQFRTALPSKGYLRHVEANAGVCRLEIFDKGPDHVAFDVGASDLLGRMALGTYKVRIRRVDRNDYSISVIFLSDRNIFRLLALTLCSVVLLSGISRGELSRLAAIPIILLSGHLGFWGAVPGRIRRIKDRLFDLDTR